MDDKNKEYIDDELLDNEEELQNSEDFLSSDQQMTSSRQKFGQKEFIQSEGKRDYYKNQAMMHKQRIDKAKEEANKSQKTVKDKKGNDIVKNKNFVDKMRDKKNLAQAKGASLGNKVSGLKSKAYTMMHPVDAIKMRILNYAKYKLLIGLGIIIAVIIIIGAFVALFTDGDSNNKTFSSSYSNSAYWWPIGSADVDENGLYSGQPVGVTITSDYGYRIHPISGKSSFHNAIDIGIPTGTPIIAMADGTVTKTVTGCIVGDYNCGGSCGNYVVLSHRDGLSTMYCHNSTVEVKVGDNVKQGQMIAKAGTTGSSTGPHLHFNIKLNGASVNPLDYVSASDPRPINMVGGDFGDFSLTETSLSKQEFIQAINNYYNSHPVDNYKKYLVNNADTIYTASKSAGINPELVVARAMLEGFSPGGNTNNWWGISCTNTGGGRDCRTYPNLTSGIEAFATIVKRNSSLKEMMSTYAYIGQYWYNPGTWSTGGCKYFDYIKGYMSNQRVSTVSSVCGSSRYCDTGGGASCTPTNSEDQEAYTMYQVQRMTEVRNSVFM